MSEAGISTERLAVAVYLVVVKVTFETNNSRCIRIGCSACKKANITIERLAMQALLSQDCPFSVPRISIIDSSLS